MTRAVKPISIILGAILSLALRSSTALAQCAMCKVAAAASGNSAADTFNLAILVLLIPPVAIFCAIFIVAFRYRNIQGRTLSETPKEDRVRRAWLEKQDVDASGKGQRDNDGARAMAEAK